MWEEVHDYLSAHQAYRERVVWVGQVQDRGEDHGFADGPVFEGPDAMNVVARCCIACYVVIVISEFLVPISWLL